jgi:hypothetical protein
MALQGTLCSTIENRSVFECWVPNLFFSIKFVFQNQTL